MDNLTFGIVGNGIIGQATRQGLIKDRPTIVYDLLLPEPFERLAQCDIVFFCIPTFNQENIETLRKLTIKLHQLNPQTRIVYRSTVPVGVCQQILDQTSIHVYYMPEFLRERMWQEECHRPELVIGQQDKFNWQQVFPDKKIIQCRWSEAELVKMFSNNLNAMKTVFANHFYDLAETVGADYQRVVELWQTMANEQTYLDAGSDLRGFGGKCLPKDLDFIIETFKQLGIEQTLFNAVQQDNTKWPTTKKS